MKKHLIALLIFVAGINVEAFSQTSGQSRKEKQEEEIKSKNFSDDPSFAVSEIPEKWKGESAVILAQKFSYTYRRSFRGTSVYKTELIRRRVKILDKAAVDQFSTIYYFSSGQLGEIAVRIHKPEGKTQEVDGKNAVTAEADIPSFYRSQYISSNSYKKIAIPDLQPGDIVDYYYNQEDYYYTIAQTFSPFIFTLAGEYPIVHQEIEFNVERGFYINFNSMNGAPDLSSASAGLNKRGKVTDNVRHYSFVDEGRDKETDDRWHYSIVTEPAIKFQVVYLTPAAVSKTTELIGKIDEVKKTVSNKELRHSLKGKYKARGILPSNATYKSVKAAMPLEKDPEKLAIAAYYHYRLYFYTPPEIKKNNLYYSYYQSRKGYSISDEAFVFGMGDVLKKFKIPYEIIITTPRFNGSIDDVVMNYEVSYILKVNTPRPIYLTPFDINSTHNYIKEEFQGAKGYSWNFSGKKDTTFKLVVLPVAETSENKFSNVLNVELNEDMEISNISKTTTLKGLLKKDFSGALLYYENFDESDKKLLSKKYVEEKPRGRKSVIEEAERKEKAEKEANMEDHKKRMKEMLEDDFQVADYKSYKLINPGRYSDSPELVYQEDFTVKGMVNKAGRNYIFNAGALIGKQLELKEKEINRTADVFLDYKRTFENVISFTIPQGLTVENISDLNMNIDNAAGSFKSVATVEGNKLVIKTEKLYKKIYDKKENWKDHVEFLDAAYKFSQKKVIMKKA